MFDSWPNRGHGVLRLAPDASSKTGALSLPALSEAKGRSAPNRAHVVRRLAQDASFPTTPTASACFRSTAAPPIIETSHNFIGGGRHGGSDDGRQHFAERLHLGGFDADQCDGVVGRQVRPPCNGKTDVQILLDAFEQGADAVVVVACSLGNCHHVRGNERGRARVARARRWLEQIGLEPERLEMHFVSGGMGATFARILQGMTARVRAFGPNPLRRASAGDSPA